MNEEELRHRIKYAIVLLADGHTFKVGDLTFGSQNKNHFSVTGWTVKNDLKNITKETALTELNETKELLKKIISISPELAKFIDGREIEYCLGYDYGMGGLEICTETNGQLKWITDLTK